MSTTTAREARTTRRAPAAAARARSCSTPPPPRAAAAGCTSSTSRWRTSRAAPARGDDADPGVAMRRADAAAHRADLAAALGGAAGSALDVGAAGVRLAGARGGHRRRSSSGPAPVPDFVGGRGAARRRGPPGRRRGAGAGRAGRPASGWWPLIVVRHRVTDPGGGRAHVPARAARTPTAAAPDDTRRIRTVTRDVLRLAHLHRMLRAAGLAPPESPGAGLGRGRRPRRRRRGVDRPGGARRARGGRSALETYDRRHADRLAVAEAARRRAPALAEPSRITECRRCPWWPTCEAELRAVDDVSLVVRGDAALRLRGRGVTTVRELAALDPAVGLARPAPGRPRGGRRRARGRRARARRSPSPAPGVATSRWCAVSAGPPWRAATSRWTSTWRASARTAPTCGARCSPAPTSGSSPATAVSSPGIRCPPATRAARSASSGRG